MADSHVLSAIDGQLSTRSRQSASAFRTLGLTGGIAAGKSSAGRVFVEAGIPVIDADQISRELTSPGGMAHEAIAQRFGTSDRRQLRALVFGDPDARRDLEAILHPLIQAESLKRIKSLAAPIVLYEAALLVETGRYRDFDGLIVVETPWTTRLERLIKRDGHAPELAEAILRAQASDEERRKAATILINNSGTQEELREQIIALVEKLRDSSP